jgi:hypothetical protein
MIRINLAKNAQAKPKKEFKIPRGVIVFLIVLIGAAVLVEAFILVRPLINKPAVVLKTPIQTSGPAPSSIVKSAMVEDVVQDADTKSDKLDTTSGYLHLPYLQLSLQEKINFEAVFAKNICELLARAVPEKIGLHTLEFHDYKTVYAVGLGSSRELINEMFSALKKEPVTVMLPPYSFIKPNQGGGYRFAVSCRIEWGLKINDPFVDLSLAGLPYRESLRQTIKDLDMLARASKVDLYGTLNRDSAGVDGSYQRFLYQVKGTSSYVAFTQFLKNLYDKRMYCAFKDLTLTASDGAQVSFSGNVIITTKE